MLIRNALTKQQEDALEIWLRSITHDLTKNKWGYEFWLNADSFPGEVSKCLFYLSLSEAKAEWDEDVPEQIEAHLGYLPEQSINISSGCNQNADHLTLAHFVLHLAVVYNGFIDLNGAITPPLKPVNRVALDEWLAEGPERAKERRTFMQVRMREIEASLNDARYLQ